MESDGIDYFWAFEDPIVSYLSVLATQRLLIHPVGQNDGGQNQIL